MFYTDMHIHALYGVDDGASDEMQMRDILCKSYQDGVRLLCFTPHFHPHYFGDNRERVQKAYAAARAYAAEKLPGLSLFLGNELRYDHGCVEWIRSGSCLTIAGTDYVLFDFLAGDDKSFIVSGVRDILRSGYRPILAHGERYSAFFRDRKTLYSMKNDGVCLQIDSGSLTGAFGRAIKKQAFALLDDGICDFISSDTHEPEGERYYSLPAAEKLTAKRYGGDTAEALFLKNAWAILQEEN